MKSRADSTAKATPNLMGGLVVSWVAQILQILSGFVVPRMLDRSLGPDTLGVWDLGWSLVSYFTLLEAGIGSSINRHVALHRAGDEMNRVNQIVSSVAMLQRAVGVVVLLLTLLLSWKIGWLLRDVPEALEQQGRWLVGLLGTGIALSFSGAIYTGVLTGCHRWAAHHGVYAATNILSFAGMLTVLWCGMGITALATVHLCTELLGRIIRAIIAYRVCPGLSVRLRHADSKTLRAMLSFGGRMFLGRVSQILMIQTTSILIAGYLGPAALALFARPRSLIRQAAVFPQKYAFMLVPSVASLAGSGMTDEVRDYVKSSGRNGLWMALPIIAFLSILGPQLMELWMGARYADSLLILVLTLGFASELANMPLNNLLMGLNLHGRPGLVSLAGAIVSILLVWGALAMNWNLPAVAVAMTLPWTIAHGLYLPWYACSQVGLSWKTYLGEVWRLPLICMIPFTLCLGAGRLLFPHHAPLALSVGGIPGGLILAVLYWRLALPPELKIKLKAKIGGSRAATRREVEQHTSDLSHGIAPSQPDTTLP